MLRKDGRLDADLISCFETLAGPCRRLERLRAAAGRKAWRAVTGAQLQRRVVRSASVSAWPPSQQSLRSSCVAGLYEDDSCQIDGNAHEDFLAEVFRSDSVVGLPASLTGRRAVVRCIEKSLLVGAYRVSARSWGEEPM